MSDTSLFSYPVADLLQYFPVMIDGSLQLAIEASISGATDKVFKVDQSRSIGGGCINTTMSITGQDGRLFFIKQNTRDFLRVFEVEAEALRAMAATQTIRVPTPVATCQSGNISALVLEFLPISGQRQDWSRLGRELARMHRVVDASFGWISDNWIGATVQVNTRHPAWIEFYIDCRLNPQFRMARNNGLRLPNADALIEAVPAFFDGYSPQASLLHGDLWAGNAGFLQDGTPVIYDPASYYGDREADLAMTRLFGGFPQEFYSAYHNEWPVDSGFRLRRDLYNLYHVLNHFNLFGGGYGSQAGSMVNALLSCLYN